MSHSTLRKIPACTLKLPTTLNQPYFIHSLWHNPHEEKMEILAWQLQIYCLSCWQGSRLPGLDQSIECKVTTKSHPDGHLGLLLYCWHRGMAQDLDTDIKASKIVLCVYREQCKRTFVPFFIKKHIKTPDTSVGKRYHLLFF